MAVSEQLQKLEGNNQYSVDPNVTVPEHVRRAAEQAEAIHKQAYEPPAPTAEEIAARARDATNPNELPRAQELPVAKPADQQQPALPGVDPKTGEVVSEESWHQRYLSMQGRWQSAQKTIGAMEEQMRQLGVELVRTQNMMQQPNAQLPPTAQNHNKLITDEDRANYGDDIIDLARRAATEALTPEIEALRADNQRLNRQVSTSGKRELFQELTAAIPGWRQVNQTVQWKTWLTLPNIYTGTIRQKMLDAAIAGAEAPKVIALFKDFLAEANATGQTVPMGGQEQQLQQQPAPRDAALNLETLAAPGRARPAGGENQTPAEKPIYKRTDISKFYDDVRKGLYAGREAEYRATEADLTAAQREGRIRG